MTSNQTASGKPGAVQDAYRLLVIGADAAAITQQVQLALSRDGQLDVEALGSRGGARR